MRRPLVIAHRGASHDAPENTMAAFRLAWEQGADALETDLRLTADGHIVACHDADARRTLGARQEIRRLTLAEIRALDAGSWRDSRWSGERMPTLPEILATLPPGGRLVLELKEDLVASLARELSQAPQDRITLIAFDAATIAAAKKRLPACTALWLFNDYGSLRSSERGAFLLGRVRALGLDGVDLRHEYRLTAEVVRPLQEHGHTIYAYTINHARAARHCAALGVDGITTDRPGATREWLGFSA